MSLRDAENVYELVFSSNRGKKVIFILPGANLSVDSFFKYFILSTVLQ